jgi:hypothetical protein
MPRASRLLAFAALALAACSQSIAPHAGGDGGPIVLPDGGPLPDGGGPLPDGGVPLPDGGSTAACAATADCSDERVCILGACASPGSVAAGGRCGASRDCEGGNYCSPFGFCAPSGSGADGGGCTTDADCGGGLRCTYQGFSGTCGRSGGGEPGSACSAQTDCLAGLFCSSGAGGTARTCQGYGSAFPVYAGPTCQDDGPLRVYFQVPRANAPLPDFFRLPYPNDARVHTDGSGVRHLDIQDFPTPGIGPADVDLVALYRDALTEDFSGFSTIAPVTFRFSGGIDFHTLEGAVHIIDLTEPTNTSVFFYAYSYISNGNHYNCPNRLTLGPGESTPLRPGHTYAFLLTSGVRDAQGNGVLADADLTALLGASAPSDAALADAYATYAPLRAWLADSSHGIAPSTVIGASVFTTADVLAPMAAVSQAVAAEPAPVLSDLAVCGSGQASSCDELGPDHACATSSDDFFEIHGRIAMPIFQQGTEPYLLPDAGGGIAFDASGAALKQRDEGVCFALTVPKSAMPAAGWPLVITHHGTGGSMTDFIRSGVSTALAQAATPMAVMGFDAIEHADRRGASTESPDRLVFNPLNPRAARDGFLQGAADILTEARVAGLSISATGGPSAPVSFDASKVVFFGHSQGSTSGELALPFLDAAPTAVLSGASSHLTQSLLHKTSPLATKAGLALLLQEDVNQLDDQHPVLGLFQNYFDRADPINSTPHIIRQPLSGHAAHSVLMTWGTGDTYTPLQTLQANAVSLGIPVSGTVLEGEGLDGPVTRPVSGNLSVGGAAVTGVLVQYATPAGDDGHFVAFDVPSAVTDWTGFIQSGLSGPPTLAP